MILDGKVALVTGGSRGIGRQVSLRLAKMGAIVGINYVSNSSAAEQTISEIEQAGGMSPYEAVIQAAVSRLMPVLLGAGTTVLGVAPLLQDVFWISMSVTIMAGLAVGTSVTMIIVPVLYATLFRVQSPKES